MTTSGYGVQVSAERTDRLDAAALEFVTGADRPLRLVEIGCGVGAQAARMASAGADVVAVDIADFSDDVHAFAESHKSEGRITFVQAHALDFLEQTTFEIDVLYSQRTLHYLPYSDALGAMRMARGRMGNHSRAFLSLSGLSSELGEKYPHFNVPIADRFCGLARNVRDVHRIWQPICLYTTADAKNLLTEAGFQVLDCWTSEFGNVKLVARPGLKEEA